MRLREQMPTTSHMHIHAFPWENVKFLTRVRFLGKQKRKVHLWRDIPDPHRRAQMGGN